MAYIIDNITVLKKQKFKKTSILIQGNRIEMIRPSFQKYRCVRMDGAPYIMTPTPIILDNKVTKIPSVKEQKNYIENNFIKKGITSFLTCCEINKEKELDQQFKQMKNVLMNCSIDYIISIKIPLKLLSAAFIRKCKKERIPAVFVEIKEKKDLYKVPWGWIKESMFPYNCPLVPVLLIKDEQEKRKTLDAWAAIMRDAKIPSVPEEVTEGEVISYSTLIKIGIYPFKGNIYQGGDVTYNLYEKNRQILNIEQNELFHYHSDRIQFTIHKGVCIRAGEKVYFRPGFGEQIEVKVPSFFAIGGV
ncbi:hypothetical protein [Niallia sp. 03133]|uniref:hypothetical protein n=1 Tax=Niallia sp. 03133 TaxID=3458060 RepID=UPI004044F5AA